VNHLKKRPRPQQETAESVLSRGQIILLLLALAGAIYGAVTNWHESSIIAIACIMVFWIFFVGFQVLCCKVAIMHHIPVTSLVDINDPKLPSYSILIALYHEVKMLQHLVEAISNLQYDKSKLQVLLLLEEDDEETWSAVNNTTLPSYFSAVSIPSGGPRTKPNALNYGLKLATGEICVIYDAEDRPQSDQLLKAVASFRHQPARIACLQAQLRFWNECSTIITRFYWAEYVIHFERRLAGLAKLGCTPPLGGTSNHFVTAILREIGGWDSFNVTEDADIAARLACYGYSIAMLDSVTWEEATANIRKADRQRRRWFKGYAQTGLVYTRRPISTSRQMGLKNWFFFNLIMLGTPLSTILSPIFWAATVIYFVTRTTIIQQLFPLPLYYMGIILMIVGNLQLFYLMVDACMDQERKQNPEVDGYSSVKYMLLIPLWWAFTSWSAYISVFELIISPHHWHKTEHGHDLEKEQLQEQIA